MNIFKTNPEDYQFYKITPDNFERISKKRLPWYQGKGNYFAICPVCSNPIQLIRLYPNKLKQNQGVPYGKHYNKSVLDVALLDPEALEHCPLYDKGKLNSNLDSVRPQTNKASKDVIQAILENFPSIISICQKITGINFSINFSKKLLENFCEHQGYLYQHTYIYNIPWMLLYRAQSLNIFKQYLRNLKLIDVLQKNNPQFISEDNQLISESKVFASYQVYFRTYQISKKQSGFNISEKFSMIVELNNMKVYEENINFNYDLIDDLFSPKNAFETDRSQALKEIAKKVLERYRLL